MIDLRAIATALLVGLSLLLASRAAFAAAEAIPTVAVVFAEADDAAAAGFADIVDSIAANPDMRVYRIALGPESGDVRTARTVRHPTAAKLAALAAEGGSIAVIYPDIGEPYRSVFTRIVEGIEDNAKARVVSYAVGTNRNSAELAGELRRQDIKLVIALGRQGVLAASGLDKEIGVIAAGVLAAPGDDARNMAVHSLAPDPALLFARLRLLAPAVRRIHVVYDARQNDWLIRLAREAARAQGFELIGYDAGDLRAAARQYQDIFAAIDARHDAIWLPQDSATDEAAVMPMVLQEAWSRNLTVFSSSVAHVRRGALFALYPNNVELGRSLANTAIQYLNPGSTARRSGVAPLREVLVAVNLRTASHLGLDLGQRQFDLAFPEP